MSQQIKVEIKKLENSEVEITGAISVKDFEIHREKAIKNLAKNISIPGFRKGHIPEKVLEQKAGGGNILKEMADLALREEYPKIIIENKIDAIGKPEISITKLAGGNPLEFKIIVAVMPEVQIADYKMLAKKMIAEKSAEVTEKEIEDTIMEIRKMRAKATSEKQPAASDKQELSLNKKGGEKEKLPELNDEFVKTLGDFKNVSEFKEKLKENIGLEKKRKANDKRKSQIMEEITKNSKIILPNIIIESELDKMIAQFKGDIAQSGGTFEEYLKHIKKSEEDVRRDWRADAEKRAKSQLILNKIAMEEKIVAPKEEVEKQMDQLISHYKDADPERVRIYVETILTNEKVFEFLENQGAIR